LSTRQRYDVRARLQDVIVAAMVLTTMPISQFVNVTGSLVNMLQNDFHGLTFPLHLNVKFKDWFRSSFTPSNKDTDHAYARAPTAPSSWAR